jgi:hypothetical protein
MAQHPNQQSIVWTIAFGAVLALVGYFVYFELTRHHNPPPEPEQQEAPVGASQGTVILWYLKTAGPVVNRIGDCDKSILALVEGAMSDHSKVSDSQWKESIAIRRREVADLTTQLKAIHPPDVCQKYQDTMMKILAIMSDVAGKLQEAKDRADVDEAAADLAKINPLLDQASSQIDELKAIGMKGQGRG